MSITYHRLSCDNITWWLPDRNLKTSSYSHDAMGEFCFYYKKCRLVTDYASNHKVHCDHHNVLQWCLIVFTKTTCTNRRSRTTCWFLVSALPRRDLLVHMFLEELRQNHVTGCCSADTTQHTHIHDLCAHQHNEHVHDHSLTTTSRATLLKHWLCSVVWRDQQNKQSYLTHKQWPFSVFEQSSTTSRASLNISSDRVQSFEQSNNIRKATLDMSSDRVQLLNNQSQTSSFRTSASHWMTIVFSCCGFCNVQYSNGLIQMMLFMSWRVVV